VGNNKLSEKETYLIKHNLYKCAKFGRIMGDKNLVQVMTYMYFTIAHQGDGEITPDEVDKARSFTLRYSGNSPTDISPSALADFEYNFTEACNWYDRALNGGSDMVFKQYSVNVGSILEQANIIGTSEESRALRQQIYDDLTAIASADGEITQGEKAILDKTASAWGLI